MAKYKFKLIAGQHAYNEGTDIAPKMKVYMQGDEFESNDELDTIFNRQGSIKFARLDYIPEDTEELLLEEERKLKARKAALLSKKSKPKKALVTVPGDDESDFKSMTTPQLEEMAEANGIDISDAKNRREMIEILTEATASV
jgi:hypothetical protein